MLSALTFAWGILAIIGMIVGFIPCLAGWGWVNILFSVTGAIIGLVSIFRRPQGGSKYAVIGIALCMAAAIIGIIRILLSEAQS